MKTHRERLILGIFVILGLMTFMIGVDGIFVFGHEGWCAARRAVAGRNFLRYGFMATGFGPVENYGIVGPDQFQHYWHHPPGIHLLVGMSFKIFGIGEWQARLVPLLISLMNLVVFYRLIQRDMGVVGQIAGMAFFISTPMMAYYGPFVNQEALTLLVCMGSLLLYRRWRDDPHSSLKGAAVLAVIAAWSDWPWFVFAFLIASVEMVRQARRYRKGEEIQWRWLVVFSCGVLVGCIAMTLHLMAMQGGEWSLEAFINIFRHRSGAEKESLKDLLFYGGHRWVELFTPTLIAAGLLWLMVLGRDLRRGQIAIKHVLALTCLTVGVGWVLLFKQGARIHEYWPFYAVIFFIISGADCLDRLHGLLIDTNKGGGNVRRWAAALVVFIMVGAQCASGYTGLLGRHHTPDWDNPQESDDFRFRHSLLGQWLHEHSEPDDRVLFHDVILGSHFQVGFYADRAHKTFKIYKRTRQLPSPRNADWRIVDLKKLPEDQPSEVVRSLVERHPVTVLEHFVIADLRTRIDNPDLTYIDRRTHTPGLLHRWLVSLVYEPFELVEDPLLAAQFLMHLGFDVDALEIYRDLNHHPDTLRHRVADHNLAILGGLTPETSINWLRRHLPAAPGQEDGLSFDNTLTMLGVASKFTWRFGVNYSAVYRSEQELAAGWRPYVHRISWSFKEQGEAQRTIVRPQSTWVFPEVHRWRPQMLYHFHGHFGLNRRQTGADVRWGFWRPPMDKAPKKFLSVEGRDYVEIPSQDVIVTGPMPSYLRWLDFRWLKENEGS